MLRKNVKTKKRSIDEMARHQRHGGKSWSTAERGEVCCRRSAGTWGPRTRERRPGTSSCWTRKFVLFSTLGFECSTLSSLSSPFSLSPRGYRTMDVFIEWDTLHFLTPVLDVVEAVGGFACAEPTHVGSSANAVRAETRAVSAPRHSNVG